jgi:hypothetical protein
MMQSGMVIDNQRIQQLPAYDRNALAFATPHRQSTALLRKRATTPISESTEAGRPGEYFIDGVPVTTGYQHNVPTSVLHEASASLTS